MDSRPLRHRRGRCHARPGIAGWNRHRSGVHAQNYYAVIGQGSIALHTAFYETCNGGQSSVSDAICTSFCPYLSGGPGFVPSYNALVQKDGKSVATTFPYSTSSSNANSVSQEQAITTFSAKGQLNTTGTSSDSSTSSGTVSNISFSQNLDLNTGSWSSHVVESSLSPSTYPPLPASSNTLTTLRGSCRSRSSRSQRSHHRLPF